MHTALLAGVPLFAGGCLNGQSLLLHLAPKRQGTTGGRGLSGRRRGDSLRRGRRRGDSLRRGREADEKVREASEAIARNAVFFLPGAGWNTFFYPKRHVKCERRAIARASRRNKVVSWTPFDLLLLPPRARSTRSTPRLHQLPGLWKPFTLRFITFSKHSASGDVGSQYQNN